MASLFVVATPIGNLSDMSERAKATLASVHTILCEDTRVSRKLVEHLLTKVRPGEKLSTPDFVSYHQHSSDGVVKRIFSLLEQGHDLALITDAGTPSISDPGGLLVKAVVDRFGDQVTMVPIPGPSAVIAALSVAGVSADRFVFLGFPPNKKGRQTFFDRLGDFGMTVVFYESTHRILKALEAIEKRFPNQHLVVCRELTKLHETIYRGTAKQVTEQLKSTSIKGEFVIVL